MPPEDASGLYHSELAMSFEKHHLDYLKHIAIEDWGDADHDFWVGLYHVSAGNWTDAR